MTVFTFSINEFWGVFVTGSLPSKIAVLFVFFTIQVPKSQRAGEGCATNRSGSAELSNRDPIGERGGLTCISFAEMNL